MNRLIIALSLLLACVAAQAENYFTMGENDTLRIAAGCDTVTVPVRAHFDGRVSSWNLTLSWPAGLEGISVAEGPDMTVGYLDSQGQEQLYDAVVTTSSDLTTISSIIAITTYYPYAGSYIANGRATWEAGDYDEMFYLTLKVGQGYEVGILSFDGLMIGYVPTGGGVGNVNFYHPVTVLVTRIPGDLNGDGKVSITDVADLIDLLLNGRADQAGSAADFNGDGHVTITDVTDLIDYLLNRN